MIIKAIIKSKKPSLESIEGIDYELSNLKTDLPITIKDIVQQSYKYQKLVFIDNNSYIFLKDILKFRIHPSTKIIIKELDLNIDEENYLNNTSKFNGVINDNLLYSQGFKYFISSVNNLKILKYNNYNNVVVDNQLSILDFNYWEKGNNKKIFINMNKGQIIFDINKKRFFEGKFIRNGYTIEELEKFFLDEVKVSIEDLSNIDNKEFIKLKNFYNKRLVREN